jgi:hypothetical protein
MAVAIFGKITVIADTKSVMPSSPQCHTIRLQTLTIDMKIINVNIYHQRTIVI